MNTRYTDTADVPLALAVFLATDHYDHNDDPNTISATTLLKPVRQIVLGSRVPPTEALISLPETISSRLGTAIHNGIDCAWRSHYALALEALGYPERIINAVIINPPPGTDLTDKIPIYLEQRSNKKVGKWTVSGKFDFVIEGRVQDFKTASVWSYKNQSNADKQIMQGSLYRWLNPEIITNDHIDIIHIFMDWQRSMAKSDPTYPSQRFKSQPLPLLSVAAANQFAVEKLNELDRCLDLPEAELPLCSDEDLWRKAPHFKYYKNPQKTNRSTKNYDTKQDAYIRLAQDGNVGIVKEVPGQVVACKYCSAFPICGQKDTLIASGDLIL